MLLQTKLWPTMVGVRSRCCLGLVGMLAGGGSAGDPGSLDLISLIVLQFTVRLYILFANLPHSLVKDINFILPS
jgi:hypothetical protein